MELGKPDEDFKNAKGNYELIYNTKKYGIPCERRFEINPEKIVIGFVSNGFFNKYLREKKSPQARSSLFNFNKFFLFIFWYDLLTSDC